MPIQSRSLIIGTVIVFILIILGIIVGVGVGNQGVSITSPFVEGGPLSSFKNTSAKDINDSISTEDDLASFADNLQSGGPPPDGIPPIDDPKDVLVSRVDFLRDDEKVFIVDQNDEVKIYPQHILVWHEIVNDTFGGEELSVTYCPLTGSLIGYNTHFDVEESRTETNFGTSGKLVNSNLVMYDRATDSLWPQILGMGITGEGRGSELETFPTAWTDWKRAKAEYPDALVLTEETGFFRRYGTDPYGSYENESSYYNEGKPFFPLMNDDDRLNPKEIVLGIKVGKERSAILKQLIVDEKVVETVVGERRILGVHDEKLDTIWAFDATEISHNIAWEEGEIVDERGIRWSVEGAELLSSKGEVIH